MVIRETSTHTLKVVAFINTSTYNRFRYQSARLNNMRYISVNEALERYDDMLNECYGEIDICGLKYNAAYALKRLDPTAYGCGMNDWLDSENLTTDKDEESDHFFISSSGKVEIDCSKNILEQLNACNEDDLIEANNEIFCDPLSENRATTKKQAIENLHYWIEIEISEGNIRGNQDE